MKIIGVIPARYHSSRFEGKPLADIHGKPMIWWVYQQAKKVKALQDVYVATDNDRIKKRCEALQMKVIMTSPEHPTGTDRIGEVAQKISADVYVNIQGDEPLIHPHTIEQAIRPFYDHKEDIFVTNMMTEIKNSFEIIDSTVPKVVVNEEGEGIYLSRSPIPYPKGKECKYYKQVCVYGFTPKALTFFQTANRGRIEAVEDIELLRFIEKGYQVALIETERDSISVDTKQDLIRVRKVIAQQMGE